MATGTNVVIDGEQYSIHKIPDESSAIVCDEKKHLVGFIDLGQLVVYLGHVGSFIRIAYNAVGAAGPSFQELQIEIQRLGYDITKLCDKSAVTVANFESTSKNVLSELKTSYQYLLDGFEDMALISFSNLSEKAKQMAAAANELQIEFETQERKVVSTLETTQKKKACEEIKIEEWKRERERMEQRKKAQQKLIDEHSRLEQEARKERLYYEQQEDEAMDSSFSLGLTLIGAVLTSVVPKFVGDALKQVISGNYEQQGKRMADRYKEKSIQKLEVEKEQRKLRQEGIQKMADFVVEISRLTSEENVAEIAIKSLHEASGALKHLSVIMRQAALFWEQLSKHCANLAKQEFQAELNHALENYSDDRKKKFFAGDGFKEKAVRYYARWVALHSVCHEYLLQIKLTREDLYQYIMENPTREESRQQLPILAEEFSVILKTAQKEIAQRDFAADEEIKMLKQD